MKAFFDSHNKSGYERTDRSLRSRWGVISSECQKLSAMLAGVDKVNPSGTSERDRVICFLLIIPTAFISFISCYSYLFCLMYICYHCTKHVQGKRKEEQEMQGGVWQAFHLA
jgi:hypothetical protein